MGFGTGRTGHAGRAWEGHGDADRWCIGLVLRAPAKPGSQRSLQGAESQRSCLAGSWWHLRLALAMGTGAEARHGPLGQSRTPQHGAGGCHPTGTPGGSPPWQGLQGSRGRRGAGLVPCMLHRRLWDLQNRDAGKWGTSRDPRRGGGLGYCGARRMGVPRMGAPTEEQSSWSRECPRGKRELGDQGSPRMSTVPGKRQPEERAGIRLCRTETG